MHRIAFYGKGGIGKSTIATGVSIALAQQGLRVLHVGCDPKADSTLVLTRGQPQRTVLGQSTTIDEELLSVDDLIMPGLHGIDCIEAGGPAAGIGCGGQAVVGAFELLEELEVFDPDRYDVVIFDVLGDVVCGGFAMPMRTDGLTKVAIVVSEEMMAAFAANNIARACHRFADEGLALTGLVANLRDPDADTAPLERFADAIGTRILRVLPRDARVGRAELLRRSILDHAPDAPVAVALRELAAELLAMDPASCPVPQPLDGDRVREVMRGPLDLEELEEEGVA
ncbi:MAG: AAA family ATPase [Alphaproteobacteria bacterium]|nr:AAA family ATPase [Alphaproteobacteria bacterium]